MNDHTYLIKPKPKIIPSMIEARMIMPKFQKLYSCCCDGRSMPSYGGKLLYLQYKKKRVVSSTIVIQESNCHTQLNFSGTTIKELHNTNAKKKNKLPNNNHCHVAVPNILFPK